MPRPASVFSWAASGGAYIAAIPSAIRNLGFVPFSTSVAEWVNQALNDVGDWIGFVEQFFPQDGEIEAGRITGTGDPGGSGFDLRLVGTLEVDEITIDGTSAGFNSSGELTFATATNGWSLSAKSFESFYAYVKNDTTSLNAVQSAAFGGVTFEYVEPALATNDAYGSWQVPVPAGATIIGIQLRIVTEAGGTGNGACQFAVRTVQNRALTGTVVNTVGINVLAPAAGNVLLTTQAASLLVDELTEVYAELIVSNATPNNANSVGFVSCNVQWTFTQPGAY